MDFPILYAMKLSILIVDDHLAIIEGYKAILAYSKAGFELDIKQALSCEEAYNAIIQAAANEPFDIVMADVTLPPYPAQGLFSGEDVVQLVQKHLPEAKTVVLTSHSKSIVLFRILSETRPDGLMVKSDFTAEEFLEAFEKIALGEKYYTKTVLRHRAQMLESGKFMDQYNRQIVVLLSQGIMSKTIQEQLCLSKSAVDKRKALLKDFFGIEKGTDEDIVREARRRGFI